MQAKKLQPSIQNKLLLLGDSHKRSDLREYSEEVSTYYYKTLIELAYDPHKSAYDAAIIDFYNDDERSVDAAHYLSVFYKGMPIFIVSSSSCEFENWGKSDPAVTYVPSYQDAMRLIARTL